MDFGDITLEDLQAKLSEAIIKREEEERERQEREKLFEEEQSVLAKAIE